MILPPFFGYPSRDREIYRLYYSYLSEDVQTYHIPTETLLNSYLSLDAITYRSLPRSISNSYLSLDAITYKKLTMVVDISYVSIDCLTFSVKYPPSIPLNIFASAGNTSSVVSWSPPASSQLPVTNYIIKYTLTNPYSILTENDYILRTENEDPLFLESSSPFTESWKTYNDGRNPNTTVAVTGLLNNNLYCFKVAAISQAGSSDYAYSNNVIPQA